MSVSSSGASVCASNPGNERLLFERIGKEESAKNFAQRMYATRQKRKNQRRMLLDDLD